MHFNCRFHPRNELISTLFAVSLLAGMLFISTSVTALADDYNIIPSIGVRGEYDDNLFYSADRIKDFRTIFMPGIDWQDKTEQLVTKISAQLSEIKYADKKQYDTVDYGASGMLNYQYTPRVNISANAQYSRDSIPSREFDPAAIVLNAVHIYQQGYSLQGGYIFNEKTSAIAAYGYTQFNYVTVPVLSTALSGTQPGGGPPGPPGGGSGGGGGGGGGTLPPPVTPDNRILTDSDVAIHAPSLSLVHKFNELTQGSLDVGYSHYAYKFSTIENYESSLTLNRALNELWSVSVTGGGRFTRSKFNTVLRQYTLYPYIFTDIPDGAGSDSSWGWVGRCALNYNGLYGGGSLSLSRDVTTGQSSANEATSVVLDTRYKFTEEFGCTFSAAYSLFNAGRGEFAGEAVDDKVTKFSAGLRYDFTKDISLDGGYTKIIANIAGVGVGKNYAFINLTVKYPLFRPWRFAD